VTANHDNWRVIEAIVWLVAHKKSHLRTGDRVSADNDEPHHRGLKEKARLSGPFGHGRYWARTSDPQLVELVLSQLS
jgi:hypothetical protein